MEENKIEDNNIINPEKKCQKKSIKKYKNSDEIPKEVDFQNPINKNLESNEMTKLKSNKGESIININSNEEMIEKQKMTVASIEDEIDNDNDDIESNNSSNNNYHGGKYFYRKLGNCYSFFANNNGDPTIIIGPQWPMYFILTFIINGIVWSFIIYFRKTYSLLYKFIGILLVVFFQLTFTYTFVINPGFPINDIGRQTGIPKDQFRYCSECKFFYDINKNVNHCYDCGICIEGYDHHCPWTSKCIGKNNLYTFYCFMTGILLNFGYAVICFTTMGR